MKNLKKVLALVVVFAMMMSTVAFAGYPDVDATADYADSVALLSALEILEGDEQGKFNPESTITRAEFAAVVCRALGLENSANSAMGATIFNDVAANHWATGYINLATQQGIVNGKGNGIFDPEGNVTYAEAVKMLVVALGYEPVAAAKGGYPTGYLAVANSIKMTAGIYGTGTNVPALRKTVAMLTANAMETPVMDQTYGTEIYWTAQDSFDNYKTLLTDMDVYVATAVVGAVDKKEGTVVIDIQEPSDDFEFGYNKNGSIKAKPYEAGLVFNVADSNVADMYQVNSKVYVEKIAKDEYNVLIAIPSDISKSLVVKSSLINDGVFSDGEVSYYESAEATKATKIDIEKAATVYVNGVKNGEEGLSVTDFASFKGVDATIEFIENSNNDDVYDVVLVTVYENAIVESVNAEEAKYSEIELANGETISLDFEDEDRDIKLVDKDGNDIALADFEKGDVLSIVVSEVNSGVVVDSYDFKEKITINNLGKNTVEGTINGIYDKYRYINDTEYEVGTNVGLGSNGDLINGAEGIFYLSATGKIIGFEGTAPVDYGYVLDVYDEKVGNNSYIWTVTMLTEDGVATYELNSSVKYNGTSYDKVGRANYATFKAAFFNGVSYTNSQTDADKKAVEYKLTSEGDIKEISSIAVAKTTVTDKEYNASTNRITSKKFDENTVVFDITDTDPEKAKVADYSILVDNGEYTGDIYAKAGEAAKVFVMTKGNSAYTTAPTLIAVSTMDTTLNGEDALLVNYYEAGEKEVKKAYFVDDSDPKHGSALYSSITKGSVFYATVSNEVVADYAILATMGTGVNSGKFAVDSSVLDAINDEVDEVEFAYGYLTIDNDNNYTLVSSYNTFGDDEGDTVDTLDFVGDVNQYQFNAEPVDSSKHFVEARRFNSNGVKACKEAGDAKYYVFVKFVDGAVADIYASTLAQ